MNLEDADTDPSAATFRMRTCPRMPAAGRLVLISTAPRRHPPTPHTPGPAPQPLQRQRRPKPCRSATAGAAAAPGRPAGRPIPTTGWACGDPRGGPTGRDRGRKRRAGASSEQGPRDLLGEVVAELLPDALVVEVGQHVRALRAPAPPLTHTTGPNLLISASAAAGPPAGSRRPLRHRTARVGRGLACVRVCARAPCRGCCRSWGGPACP